MSLRDRILQNIEVDKATGCWLWTGYVQRTGYGSISVPVDKRRGTPRAAHRVSYETFVGPIPEGLTIDHVYARGCRHRHCVNPAHLEAVTQAENNRRRVRVQRGLCPSGHRYDARNERGVRICRICCRARTRLWRQRNKAHRAAYAREYRRLLKAEAA